MHAQHLPRVLVHRPETHLGEARFGLRQVRVRGIVPGRRSLLGFQRLEPARQVAPQVVERQVAPLKALAENVDEQAHALRNLEDAAHRDSLAVGVGVRRGMIVVEGGRR